MMDNYELIMLSCVRNIAERPLWLNLYFHSHSVPILTTF